MTNDNCALLKASALKLLDVYAKTYHNESEQIERCRLLLQSLPDPFSDREARGHITASAVVVAGPPYCALLILHEKLNRWFQPGGHVETAIDGSIVDAALRECLEETGEHAHTAGTGPILIDIDIHRIPQSSKMPSHEHYDMRILFRLDPKPLRSAAMKWVPLSELAKDSDITLSRFSQKAIDLLTRGSCLS